MYSVFLQNIVYLQYFRCFCGGYYQLNVKKLVIGINGISFHNSTSNDFFRLALDDNEAQLRFRGTTDIPGVLLSGIVNEGGTILPRQIWGAKRHNERDILWISAGVYDIFHSVGHTNYNVQITPIGANRACFYSNITASSFRVTILNENTPINTDFGFVIFGNN